MERETASRGAKRHARCEAGLAARFLVGSFGHLRCPRGGERLRRVTALPGFLVFELPDQAREHAARVAKQLVHRHSALLIAVASSASNAGLK